MIRKSSAAYKITLLVMCCLLVLSSIMPMLMEQVRAEGDTVTIYFDTGNCEGNYGWEKGMSTVYCAFTETMDASDAGATYFNFPSASDCRQMTLTGYTSVKGTGGRIFSLTLPKSYVGKHFTLCRWNDKSQNGRYRTVIRDAVSVADGRLFYDTNGEYNGYECIWYESYNPVTDYAGKTFKIANLTPNAEVFSIQYSSDGVNFTEKASPTISGRTLSNVITVPSAGAGNTPYTHVRLVRNRDNVIIKTYEFSAGKCLGKTINYGVTEYHSESSYVDDADHKTLTFYSDDYGSIPEVSQKQIYFSKDDFPAGDADRIEIVVGDGASANTYSVEPVTKNGNASLVTTNPVSVSANQVFSLYYYKDDTKTTYDRYNLVWSDSSKNLLILHNKDAAQISDVMSVQSTDNTMPNGQKYMTVKADFFDYQYDHSNSLYDFNYHYNLKNGTANSYTYKANEASLGAKAKRPYMVINDAISQRAYGQTSHPMYIGQFWMPLYDNKDFYGKVYNDSYFNTSSEVYTSSVAGNVRAAHNYAGDQYVYNNDYGFYSNLGFGDLLNNFTWTANLAYRTEDQASGTYRPYDAVVQGLVAGELSGGVSDGTLMAPENNVSIPYFDEEFWTGDVDTHGHGTQNLSKYLVKYPNLDFPFFEIQSNQIGDFANGYKSDNLLSDTTDHYNGKYYVFDSKKYRVYVNTSGAETVLDKFNTGSLVYDNYGDDGFGSNVGMFPFNTPSEGGNDSKNLHYGFGIRYDIDFYLPEHGTIDGTEDGTPVTFTFQGDDDVWVFLDGKLILDMGGAHKNALGEINFKKQQTWISAVAGVNDTSIVSAGKPEKFESFDPDTHTEWASRLTTGEHTITMFYMERGMLNSNLFCMFNLPTNVTAWQLQEDTDFGRVNEGFTAAARYVADNDIFNYQVENKGTEAEDVLGSGFNYPTYEAVIRTNDEANYKSTTLNTAKTKPDPIATTESYTPRDKLYFNLPSGFGEAGAYPLAYLWGGGKYSLKRAKTDANASNKQYFDFSDKDSLGYTKMILLRMNPSYNYTDNVSDSNNYPASGVWNKTGDIDLSTFASYNTITFTSFIDGSPTPSSNTQATRTVYDDSNAYSTHNFAPTTNNYNPLMESAAQGATYRLEDMFTSNTPVMLNTDVLGDKKGIISLQYGELVTASNQFAAKTAMRVTQLDQLSKPDGNSRANGNAASDRTVSKYYDSYFKTSANTDGLTMLPSPGIYQGRDVSGETLAHADSMYQTGDSLKAGLNNYATTTVINLQVNENNGNQVMTYMFSDPTKAANTNVFLRQVVINSVKTADLKLSKFLTDGSSTKDFSFTLTFSEPFGGDSTATSKIDVSKIKYSKNGGAEQYFTSYNTSNKSVTVSLKANDYIEVKGIPVGTKYKIEEAADETYTLDRDTSVNLTVDPVSGEVEAQEITEDTDVNVFNKLKTGAIRLHKELYQENGTTRITTDDTEFEFVVTCTAPSGVAIGNYTITAHQVGTPAATETIQWVNTDGEYSLKVNVKSRSGNDDVVLDGFPLNTTYSVTETSLGGYVMMGEVEYNDSTKKVDVQYTGSSQDNAIDRITIKNKLNPIVMPETGGTPLIFVFPFGIIAILTAGAALWIYKKKFVTVIISQDQRRGTRR